MCEVRHKINQEMSNIKQVLSEFLAEIGARFLKIFKIFLFFLMDFALAFAVGYLTLYLNSVLSAKAEEFHVNPEYANILVLLIEFPLVYHVTIFIWRDFKNTLNENDD